MNKITKAVIDALSERQGGTKLTIYMPTHQITTPPTTQEDQTRYKNLIRDGYDKWCEQADEHAIKDVFRQLEEKVHDEAFWRHMAKGLAIFADESGVEFYHLPIECEEHVCVGESFDLTPLYIVQSCDQPFYLLALAMHNSKLFKGDAYGLEPIAIDFPSSPEDALNIDEMFNNSNTQRGYEGPASSDYSISTHGAGDSNHAGQEERLMYFRILDRMIADSKAVDTKLPIIIAATESEASDYKNLSKLPHVIPKYVAGNHTVTELHELHELAWKVIHDEVIEKRTNLSIERFNELKGLHKASSDLDDIREAVKTGRVDTLLVRVVPTTNDSVSETKVTTAPLIRFDEEYEQSHAEALIESTVAQGGKIIGVDPELFDIPSLAGAIYRY